MKKILLAMMAASAMFMTGCDLFGSDGDDDATVNVTDFGLSATTATPTTSNVTINVVGDISANEKITNVGIAVTDSAGTVVAATKIVANVAAVKTDAKDWDLATDGVNTIVVMIGCPGGVYTVTLSVTAGGATVTKTATLTVVGAAPGTAATEKTGGVVWNINAPAGETGAYDLLTGTALASSGAATSKDILDLSVAGSGLSLSWGTMNGATFLKNNTFAYATATVEGIQAAASAATASTVTAIAVNDIILVKFRTTHYAAIKILTVEPTVGTSTGANKGKITFSYKM